MASKTLSLDPSDRHVTRMTSLWPFRALIVSVTLVSVVAYAFLGIWPGAQRYFAPTKLSIGAEAVVIREVSLGLCALSPSSVANGGKFGKELLDADKPLLANFLYHTVGYDLMTATPSQSRIMTKAGSSPVLQLWDMASGQGMLTLNGGQGVITSAAFSADRTRIVTSSTAGELRVWDAITGQTLVFIAAHDGAASVATFSPDGTRIASAGSDGKARIWDAITGHLIMSLSGHKNALLQVAFSADGTRLVSTSLDGAARIWSLSDGRTIAKLLPAGGAVLTAAFSHDGRFIALGTQFGATTVWNALTGQQLASLDGSGDVLALAFSPDGARLATAEDDDSIKLWDTSDWQLAATLVGHEVEPFTLSFNSAGTRLLTGSRDETVREWDTHDGKLLSTLDGPRRWLRTASISPDGSRVVTASDQHGFSHLKHLALLWNTSNKEAPVSLLADGSALDTVAFSPSNRVFATVESGATHVRASEAGQVLSTLQGQSWPSGPPSFDRDGQVIALPSTGLARVWNAYTGILIASLRDATTDVAAFLPQNARIVLGSSPYGVATWSFSTNQVAHLPRTGRGIIRSIDDSSETGRFATGDSEGILQVWDDVDPVTPTNPEALHRHEPDYHVTSLQSPGSIIAISLNPGGHRIITLGYDGLVLVWDEAAKWQPRMASGLQRDTVIGGIGWSRDGTPLVLTCEMKAPRL